MVRRWDFDPNVTGYAIVILGELGIDPAQLATGLTHQDIETFKECILDVIFHTGNAIQ